MNNLKWHRIRSELTQEEIARLINITTRNYQYIEYGRRKPKVDTALALAKALNTTVEELFGSP